jgi:DNA-binding MarR family transcriptional regulator
LERWVREMDEVLSNLTLAFLQLERSGKCCHGVTLSQCHALDLLSKKGSLTMNELSRQMGLAKSTMTRIVNNMVREGWIDQVKDQRDKRLVNVRLTQEGKKMAETLGRSSQEYVQRILKHLPPDKIPQVVESLKWIVKSVGKEVWEGTL